MDFDSVISARHSVRGFTEVPVAAELVSQIVTLAQQTPSWCNSQAWQLNITSPAETARLSASLLEYAGSGAAAAPPAPSPRAMTDTAAAASARFISVSLLRVFTLAARQVGFEPLNRTYRCKSRMSRGALSARQPGEYLTDRTCPAG